MREGCRLSSWYHHGHVAMRPEPVDVDEARPCVDNATLAHGDERRLKIHKKLQSPLPDKFCCMESRWDSRSLHDLEDIDFEFVYALHTFVATVEGQANATKGDTMVLLDDSNSYWWLVRVVKDSSIGRLSPMTSR